MILALRTDKPEAELYLFDNDNNEVCRLLWHAHRELSDTLLLRIDELLKEGGIVASDLGALIVYRGPGSFTGLRIGITAANTLAYSLGVPISGVTGEFWITDALKNIETANSALVTPEYGSEAHITQPRK